MTRTVATEFRELTRQRTQLLRALAPTLLRVGSKNPRRAHVNKQLAARRRTIRQQLRDNSNRIITLVMLTYGDRA